MHRPAIEALWQVDAAMADVVARSTDPALARIKLAWWRERLADLDSGAVPAEPRLQLAAQHLLPRGIPGSDLADLEPGWATLLDDPVNPKLVADRGARLFRIAGQILGDDDPMLAPAGALYALASVSRRGLSGLAAEARGKRDELGQHRFAYALRPLTMLARSGGRDLSGPPFEPEGGRRRLLAMLAHRWSGRI